jgi:hypothetical protein
MSVFHLGNIFAGASARSMRAVLPVAQTAAE